MSAGQEDEVGMETEKLEYMEVNMAFDFKEQNTKNFICLRTNRRL